jgi:hypothetical protein
VTASITVAAQGGGEAQSRWGSAPTESAFARHELRPVINTGAEVMDTIFEIG